MPSTLHVSTNPAILHKLAVLRNERTEPKKFREVVRELSWLLGYEALADVGGRPITVRTPLEEMEGAQLADRIGLIPILRAGLGMVDAMLELMPTAEVWHLGLFRDERTLQPVEYYNKLPDPAPGDLGGKGAEPRFDRVDEAAGGRKADTAPIEAEHIVAVLWDAHRDLHRDRVRGDVGSLEHRRQDGATHGGVRRPVLVAVDPD